MYKSHTLFVLYIAQFSNKVSYQQTYAVIENTVNNKSSAVQNLGYGNS